MLLCESSALAATSLFYGDYSRLLYDFDVQNFAIKSQLVQEIAMTFFAYDMSLN